MAKVYIGVGHGGSDPGAVGNNFKEKDLNLSIALACRDALVRHGINVLMSRTEDKTRSLGGYISECNSFVPDYAVDIHNNAGGGDGAEVYCSINGGKGKTLAGNVLSAIVEETGQNSRGIKTRKNSSGSDYYGFIRSTNAPAIIVECAFIDNSTDIAILDTAAERTAMGEAIAKGILKTLNISYKKEASAPVEDSGKLYRVQVGAFKSKENAEKLQSQLKAAGYDTLIVEN